jgi:sugar-specific transcriptional regulator TrmB
MDKSSERLLQKLGLTEAESAVYIRLLREDLVTAGKLAKVTAYSRPKVYEILEKFVHLGLVESYPARPIRFRALNPELAISSYLKSKREELDRVEEELKYALKKHFSEKLPKEGGIFVARGLRKSTLKYCELVRSAQKQIYTFLGWVSKREIKDLIDAFSSLHDIDINVAYFKNAELKEQIGEEDLERLSEVTGNFYYVRHLLIKNPPAKFLTIDDHSLHITVGDYLDDGILKDVVSVHYYNIPVICNIVGKAFPQYFKLFTRLRILERDQNEHNRDL